MKTAKPIGISETPKFPCPKWDKVTGQLNFFGTPVRNMKKCARVWRRNIKALLEGNTRGLTRKGSALDIRFSRRLKPQCNENKILVTLRITV